MVLSLSVSPNTLDSVAKVTRPHHGDFRNGHAVLAGPHNYVTLSDKRVTKCQLGHSELFIPTESATKEPLFDLSRFENCAERTKSEVMAF